MQTNIQKNTMLNIIRSFSSVIFPLITFPYISRVLLADNIGKINFSNSIVSYFSLIASLGISTYAVRECSKVKNKKSDLGKVSSEIISINICMTILSYIFLFVVLFFSKALYMYRELIVIQSLSIFFITLGADWLNTAMEDFKYITIRTFLFQLLSLIMMFLFVKNSDDYINYAIITLISSSGSNIFNIFYRKKFCDIKFTFSLNLKKHFPPIILLFGMILSQQIFVNSDTTILGLIKGDYEVGIYSTAVRIYNIVSSILNSISWVVMSQLSYSFVKSDYKKINKLLRYVIGFTITFGLPCAIGMGVISEEIIKIVAGINYVDATIPLQILSVSLMFSLAWGIIMNMILLPSGNDNICLLACFISAIVNIILNFIFIPKYGGIAASITTTLSQFVGLIICIPHIDKRIKIKLNSSMIFGPIAGVIVIVGYLFLCKLFFSNLLLKTVFSILGSVVIYLLLQILLKNDWFIDNVWLKFLKKSRN